MVSFVSNLCCRRIKCKLIYVLAAFVCTGQGEGTVGCRNGQLRLGLGLGLVLGSVLVFVQFVRKMDV